MRIRYFTQDGKQIQTAVDPAYLYRNNQEKDQPKDFVIIKQKEFERPITDPYGNQSIFTGYTEPVEEVYCRWVWDNGSWYCVIAAVIQNGELILDNRPDWWKFVEKFNRSGIKQ